MLVTEEIRSERPTTPIGKQVIDVVKDWLEGLPANERATVRITLFAT